MALSVFTGPVHSQKGNNYIFKITVLSVSGAVPGFTVGNGNVFRTQYVGKSGKDYFFRIKAVGKPGEATGIYTAMPGENVSRSCVVENLLNVFRIKMICLNG